MTNPLWPLFDLRIVTPRLVLRLPTDDDLVAQSKLLGDVLDPTEMPFHIAWTRRPSPEREQRYAQVHWKSRAEWQPEDWNLILSVFLDGEPIGSQNMRGEFFPTVRAIKSGSWLARSHQRQGYGTEMRAGILHFAFETLGALEAHSESRIDNLSSLRVSTKLGYERNGSGRYLFGDEGVEEQYLKLTAAKWRANPPDYEISVSGFEGCAPLFGIQDAAG